jgi:hypothetical protein
VDILGTVLEIMKKKPVDRKKLSEGGKDGSDTLASCGENAKMVVIICSYGGAETQSVRETPVMIWEAITFLITRSLNLLKMVTMGCIDQQDPDQPQVSKGDIRATTRLCAGMDSLPSTAARLPLADRQSDADKESNVNNGLVFLCQSQRQRQCHSRPQRAPNAL